jgi:hypothetical protein
MLYDVSSVQLMFFKPVTLNFAYFDQYSLSIDFDILIY